MAEVCDPSAVKLERELERSVLKRWGFEESFLEDLYHNVNKAQSLSESHTPGSTCLNHPELKTDTLSVKEGTAGTVEDKDIQSGVTVEDKDIQSGVTVEDKDIQSGVTGEDKDIQSGVTGEDKDIQSGVTGEAQCHTSSADTTSSELDHCRANSGDFRSLEPGNELLKHDDGVPSDDLKHPKANNSIDSVDIVTSNHNYRGDDLTVGKFPTCPAMTGTEMELSGGLCRDLQCESVPEELLAEDLQESGDGFPQPLSLASGANRGNYSQALHCVQDGEFCDSLIYIDDALDAEPSCAALWTLKAKVMNTLGDHLEALRAVAKVKVKDSSRDLVTEGCTYTDICFHLGYSDSVLSMGGGSYKMCDENLCLSHSLFQFDISRNGSSRIK